MEFFCTIKAEKQNNFQMTRGGETTQKASYRLYQKGWVELM